MEENLKQEETAKIPQTKKKNKHRMTLVLIFIFLFAIVTYVFLRGNYLEYNERVDRYAQEFFTNLKFQK